MPKSILGDRQVREIRRARDRARAERIAQGKSPRNGYGLVKPLARLYGVSPRTIQLVIYERSWTGIK